MTTAAWVALLHARPVGPGRYLAHCPGPLHKRGDRHPSLSIREGANGRTLFHCFGGCVTADVLRGAGLTWANLFAAPLSPQQALEAKRQRDTAMAEARARRRERGALADRYRKLNELVSAMAARLVDMPEGEEGDAISSLLHSAIDRVHEIETTYAETEARGFHERLVRYCERHCIDRQRLLAPYMLPDDGHGEAA
jgi:hypothetical protein